MTIRPVAKNLFSSQKIFYMPLAVQGRRFLSSKEETSVICQCGVTLPKAKEIARLYEQRNLRELSKETQCNKIQNYTFQEQKTCALAKELHRVASFALHELKDVVYVGNGTFAMFSALKPTPKDVLGDLTGDHGKQISVFLKTCYENRLISKIGSIIDVGGQNTSTVELISDIFSEHCLPSLVIDINSLTPFLAPENEMIRYAIGDVTEVFQSDEYEAIAKSIIGNPPTLFVFNNILNVLSAEKGWNALFAAWATLRKGDYLVISGLVPEQLKKHGFFQFHEVDGIVEFHDGHGFYKSAINDAFADFVELRLKQASVLVKDTFEYKITARQHSLMNVRGYRLLALRKI